MIQLRRGVRIPSEDLRDLAAVIHQSEHAADQLLHLGIELWRFGVLLLGKSGHCLQRFFQILQIEAINLKNWLMGYKERGRSGVGCECARGSEPECHRCLQRA